MVFLDDIRPLVLGSPIRILAIYTEIIVFSIALLSRTGVISIVSFSVLGVLWMTDIVFALRARKMRKIAYLLDRSVMLKPALNVIVFDMVFGLSLLGLWVAFIIKGMRDAGDYQYGIYYGLYGTQYSIIGAFTMVGLLCVGHIHLFLGVVSAHYHRQERNGRKASRRAQGREANRSVDHMVELAPPVDGLGRM